MSKNVICVDVQVSRFLPTLTYWFLLIATVSSKHASAALHKMAVSKEASVAQLLSKKNSDALLK